MPIQLPRRAVPPCPPRPPTPPLRNLPLEIARDPEAKREYSRVISLIGDRLDERDRSLLADYAMTHAEIIKLRDEISISGRMFEGVKGGFYINPLVNILISRESHLASLRRDLYFTPKSRIEKQTKAKSKGQSILDSLDKDENE